MTGPEPSRRDMLGMAAAGLSAPVLTQADPSETIALWPGLPPGAPASMPAEQVVERSSSPALRDRIALNVARPIVTVFRPSRPNGGAVLVIPGGGFVRVAIDKEGFETARLLTDRGITAFVLRYRFPADGWTGGGLAPVQDAQRAMRVIRARASELGIDRARLAVLGFSAGGLLAALLCVADGIAAYPPIDGADAQPFRPLLAGLVYAASASGPIMPRPAGMVAAALLARPAAQLVTAATPPTALFHAGDDTTVDPQTSVDYLSALRRAKVPAELHLFEEGGHGFGLRLPPALPASHWPELFLAFAARHGLLRGR